MKFEEGEWNVIIYGYLVIFLECIIFDKGI